MPTHMDSLEVFVSESDEIVIKQDSARRGDTVTISIHPGQVSALVRWLREARADLTGEKPTKRSKPLDFFYTWRCPCGYVDGTAVGHEGRDMPEKPPCPRCGKPLRYRRMHEHERSQTAT